MSKFFKIVLIIIAIVLLSIVGVVLFARHKSLYFKENKSTRLYEPELTTLNFPVLIAISDIQKLANQKIKTVLINKTVPMKNAGDSLILKVTRMGDIRFNLVNQDFYSSIPLKIEIQVIKKLIGKKNIQIFKKDPFTLMITGKFQSKVTLQNDLKINSTTSLKEIVWQEAPNLTIMGMNFNIQKQVDNLLKEKAPEITAKIDDLIRDKINLRKPVLKIWNKLQRGLPANKELKDLYIKIQPQSLSVFVDKSKSDSLKLNMIVTSKVYLRFATDTSSIKRKELPQKIKILRKPNTQMSELSMHFLVPMEKLNEVLKQRLMNQELTLQSMRVKLQEINVINGTKDMFVKIKITGDFDGEILVKGLPVLSDDKKTIYISNIELESKLKDPLFNSFTDLLHEQINDLLKQNVDFNIEELMQSVPDFARKAINKSKMAKKAEITLNHLEVTDLKIYLTKNNVQLLIEGESDFEIAVKKEGFKLKK